MTLTTLEKEHLPLVHPIFNFENMSNGILPFAPKSILDLEKVLLNHPDRFYLFQLPESNALTPIAIVDLYLNDKVNKVGAFDLHFLSASKKALLRDATKEFATFVFGRLSLNKVSCCADADDTVKISVLKSLGFSLEVRRRADRFDNGRPVTVNEYGLLRLELTNE